MRKILKKTKIGISSDTFLIRVLREWHSIVIP